MASTKNERKSSKRKQHGRSSLDGESSSKKHILDNTLRPCRSLADIAAESVARTTPFQVVEERFAPVPEPVQLKIIYWSFPRDEDEIRMYSSLTTPPCSAQQTPPSDPQQSRLHFTRALKLLTDGSVRDVLQVGFHLSGSVRVTASSRSVDDEEEACYRVAITLDRCKITSVSCSCGSRDIFWCQHVVALALFRIRRADRVVYRVPISDTLAHLTHRQLHKLCMNLVAEHHRDVLPTCQRLADDISKRGSELAIATGFPDPTAGASKNDAHCHFLDAAQVRQQVRVYLSQAGYYNSARHLAAMFAKVREMLRARDPNGPRMLRLITSEFVADPKLKLWRQQGTTLTGKSRRLWDGLGYLWLLVVLAPHLDSSSWKPLLLNWHNSTACPDEDPDNPEQRTIFSRALDACDATWSVSVEDHACEPLPLAASRVDALRCHGCGKEALKLALGVARHVKRNRALDEGQEWVGHPTDPVLTLVDVLLDDNEHACLAYELAILALAQHRTLPNGPHAQERLCRAEDALITRLESAGSSDGRVLRCMGQLAGWLLRAPNNGLADEVRNDTVPMQRLGLYLFGSLLQFDSELAYKIGVRALRLPQSDIFPTQPATSQEECSHTLGCLQARQCDLAAAMLTAAADTSRSHTRLILDAIQAHITSAPHLFKLAQDLRVLAGARVSDALLGVAFEVGLQLMRATLNTPHWRRADMVSWQVGCAADMGPGALLTLIHSWHQLFNAREATSLLAVAVLAPNPPLDPRARDELHRAARRLVLQCAAKDPASCALAALTLCEHDPSAFDAAYETILAAAPADMSPTQLFGIARYMERRGHGLRAYRLALLALNHLTILHNHDTHPAVNDVHWTVALSYSLGREQLTATINALIRSVQCAAILSDVVRRCSPHPGDAKQRRKYLSVQQSPLRELLEATLAAYNTTIHSRLQHISPRHYQDFIDLLYKARESFLMAADGLQRFRQLLENLKSLYRGKKKLMQSIRDHLG